VGWQPTKYFDARTLAARGYTAQSTTGEMSGTQAVDFHTLGNGDYFPAGTPQRAWLDAYARGVHAFVNRTKAAGLRSYFFVDLLVFPEAVIQAYKADICDPKTGDIVWNNKTAALLATLVNETFDAFPQCDGWIVRTGETYTFDTPYHVGNTPNPSKSMSVWVSFITELSRLVNVVRGKDLFFRGWDNWPSEVSCVMPSALSFPFLSFHFLSFNPCTRAAPVNPTDAILNTPANQPQRPTTP
jgi:hypothetical protein